MSASTATRGPEPGRVRGSMSKPGSGGMEYVEFTTTIGYSYTRTGKINFRRSIYIYNDDDKSWVMPKAESVDWHVSKTKKYGDATFRLPVGSIIKEFYEDRDGIQISYYRLEPGGPRELEYEVNDRGILLAEEGGVKMYRATVKLRDDDSWEAEVPEDKYIVVYGGGSGEIYYDRGQAEEAFKELAGMVRSGTLIVPDESTLEALEGFAGEHGDEYIRRVREGSIPETRYVKLPSNIVFEVVPDALSKEDIDRLRQAGIRVRRSPSRRRLDLIVPLWTLAIGDRYEVFRQVVLDKMDDKTRSRVERVISYFRSLYGAILRYIEDRTGVKPGEIRELEVRRDGEDSVIMFKTVYLGRDRFREVASRAEYAWGYFYLKASTSQDVDK